MSLLLSLVFCKVLCIEALKIQPNQIQRKVFRAPMRFLHYSTVSNVNAAGDQGIACNFSGIIVRASSNTFFLTWESEKTGTGIFPSNFFFRRLNLLNLLLTIKNETNFDSDIFSCDPFKSNN